MEDFFNEEDLINDYIAHAEDEYEPPFEEYMGPEEPEEQEKEEEPNNAAAALGRDSNVGLVKANNDNGATNLPPSPAAVNHDDEAAVPRLISTSPSRKNDLYGFERYTGLSSWRTNDKNGSNATGEKGGATTMEATGWKKKELGNAANANNDDDDMDSFLSGDDLDKAGRARNKRGSANDTAGGSGRGGRGSGQGEAQLVRFRERSEESVLGHSWGRGERRQDIRCIYNANNGTLPKLGEDSMAITLADGTRTFVKRAAKHGIASDGSGARRSDAPALASEKEQEDCLLGMPITDLVRRADILQKRAIQRKIEREQRYGANANHADDIGSESQNQDGLMDENSNEESHDQKTSESKEATTQTLNKKRQQHKQMQLQQRLWVDKHAPTSISHLLSDERTNREVLRALRAWDPYVFKRDAPARPLSAYNPSIYSQQQPSQSQNHYKGNKNDPQRKKQDKDDEVPGKETANQRVDVRPNENSRVILLSGPPGVGKSTLAHIVCKHAGYRPIEVNASDERSAPALTGRVVRAMESSTLDLSNLVGGGSENAATNRKKGGMPNCIILDEVDGADAKSSISALVDIIRADIPPPGSKGKNKGTYLRRPIILICNHKYAPALRPILPYARQFDVQPPNPERLTGRLRAVLAAEHMSVVAGGMLLHRLVAATGGDVRSCLYALQFASARARELAIKKRERDGIVSKGGRGDKVGAVMVDISSTLMAALGDKGNGMKDMQSDVSNTVATVFRKNKSRNGQQNKRQKTSRGTASGKVAFAPKGVDTVLKVVDRFGDNSKTLDCLFMNVNRVSYVDPTLDRCCTAFEWLSSADTYRSHKSNVAMNNSAEHMSMQKFYIPSAAAAIHLLCCVETRPDLTFSTRPLSDVHYQSQANVSLVHRFVDGLAPRARRGVGGGTDTVVSDVIPYGLWLLSAGDGKHSLSKPVSSVDILSAEEKLAFSAHVETLRALGLTYVKDEGAFDYKNPNAPVENVRLEPEIDKLVKFADMDGHGRKEIPPLLKELLAHGATVATLKERESEAQIRVGDKAKLTPKSADTTVTPKVPEKPPTITPKKQPTKAGSNSSAAKNFLGKRAAKAKEAKTARRAARVGFDRSKKVKLSNTGSGVEISKVIRFKYQKGFTQAVRAPCQLEDLL